MMTKRHLPVMTEVSIAETKAASLSLSQVYQLQLQSREVLTCHSGCSNCCKHPVYISLIEGVILYRALVGADLWKSSKPKLLEASRKTWGLSSEVWALSDMDCPLLENARCIVYDDRPFSCRIAFSVGLPEDCRPTKLNGTFLPKASMLDNFSKTESEILQRHSIKLLRLPLASSVLWGEQVALGNITLEDSLVTLVKDPSNV